MSSHVHTPPFKYHFGRFRAPKSPPSKLPPNAPLEHPYSMADELVDTLFIRKEADQTIVGLYSSANQRGAQCASVWCVVMRGSREPASRSSASRLPMRPFPVPASGKPASGLFLRPWSAVGEHAFRRRLVFALSGTTARLQTTAPVLGA